MPAAQAAMGQALGQTLSMGRASTAALRLALVLAWTFLLIPPYAALLVLRGPYRRMARFYWRTAGYMLGIRVRTHGAPVKTGPVLFVANHASYLDIAVLGSVIDAGFVAKQEVGTWPGINIIAKLGRTVFVERKSGRAAEQRDAITERLESGEGLILFPEGTSNDGNRVLPFKSALFSVAERRIREQPLTVQPVSVAYTRLDGMPVGMAWRPFFAWYGDMELAPHAWWMMGFGRLEAQVVFHPPVTIEQFTSRKTMSEHCYRTVSRGVALANAGRLALLAAPVTG
jgi:1-acyl-sn-glycerol-3-phosphate acyltransferase